MAYVFTKDLETGVAQIDNQHKSLFNAMNKLADACVQGKGRDEVNKTLKFLNDYIITHFNDEEKLQAQYHYPEKAKHRTYHEQFKASVKNMIDEYNREGASLVLLGEINQKVGMWLLNHIKREDVKLGAFLKDKGI